MRKTHLKLERIVDPQATRRLAAATVLCALKDAKGRRGGDRVEAIAWLASTKATLYLDLVEIQQSSLLTKCGWLEWAAEIIHESIFCYDDEGEHLPGFPIADDQISVILGSYKYLLDLQVSQTGVSDD